MTSTTIDPSRSESLVEKLETIIQTLPPGQVTLAKIIDIIGNDSLMLITIFLSLVFLIPVSIPGVSTVFGSGILLIGVSLLFRNTLYMPKRIQERPIASEKLVKGMRGALTWLRRLEKISKPGRLPWLATRATLLNKLAYILAAVLLMMPFGFVPFSNTLPAIALIFFAIGAIQKDGLSILFGHLMNIVTIIYFGALIAAGGWTILEVLQKMRGG
ncbi:MAG: exopolysaccharide biosynthesis protein [Anaerolineales bacterium]|nr:exopolysaccharide biosynthesis protein [Anaerolineales bacterium]MCW5838908.1 exopolysaccharide biosynthesis protein [Anaerolineales bacterium]